MEKENPFDLSGKVALITGASSGLGKHFAKTLSSNGAKTILAARRVEKMEKLQSELENDSFIVNLDVTSKESVNSLKDEIEKQIKRLKKQRNDAERYKKLKSREKEIGAEIIYTKILEINKLIESNKTDSAKYHETYDDHLTKLRKIEADIEELRIKNNKANEDFNQKQKEHFAIQADIARLEQSIEYEKELASQKTINAEEIKSELVNLNTEVDKDKKELETIYFCGRVCNFFTSTRITRFPGIFFNLKKESAYE